MRGPTGRRTRNLTAMTTLTLSLGALGVLPLGEAGAATLKTFEDKAAFLAATEATNATGPLPDLGAVPLGATVGSVTFSLAPGGGALYIGAAGTGGEPDWYPPTPGNDLAMGIENLRVQTPLAVFSMGFEIVEPDTTMPPFGGTPVDSTYTVQLFSGSHLDKPPIPVGEFVFSNLPKDAVAFIGVQSDVAFDLAEIVDVTPSPFVNDDEYFGEFYTGRLPAASATVTAVADQATPIPDGTGTFTSFAQAAQGGAFSIFIATGVGQAGVYVYWPPDPMIRVADLATAIPEGAGPFTGFTQVAQSGSFTSFIATGLDQTGAYSVFWPPGPVAPADLIRVADLATPIPEGAGTFTDITQVAQGGAFTSFLGTGVGQAGVYRVSWPPGPISPQDPVRVADLTTAIPEGTGPFTGFTQVAQGDAGTSFIATGEAQAGVYFYPPTPVTPVDLVRVADLTTAIPGGTGAFTGFAQVAQGGAATSFIGTGEDQAGVYFYPPTPVTPMDLTRVADLTTAIPGGTGAFTGFTAVSASQDHTAFLGLGAGGQAGIYLASALTKVVAVGDTLEGKLVSAVRLDRNGLDGNRLAFGASFTDGSQGVFVVAANGAPDCGLARPSTARILLPLGQFVPIRILGVADPEGDPVSTTIDSIYQDETVKGGGLGLFCPDAAGLGTDKAWIRAQRDPKGNGRVYHIRFTTSDDQGGACQGEVTVCVPIGPKKACGDQGPRFDSTVCLGRH
jgi:hypothetical protein